MTLGGIEIPVLAVLDLNVAETTASRETIHEMGDGQHFKQVYAGSQKKANFSLRCQGVVPPGLDGLDTTGQLVLQLASERSISSPSNIIALPAARRTDAGYAPWGRAFVQNEIVPDLAVSVVGDVATVATVSGSNPIYQVLWYPQLTVYTVGDIEKSLDVHGAVVSWSLTLIEV